MKYRKLRIAWSVVWGIVAVLFATVWVCSSWWEDIIVYRCLAVLLATVAVAPLVPWRFSLRTLLIASTLIAIGLGLIVWATRAR